MNFLTNLFRGSRSLKMRAVPRVGAVCEEHHVNKNSIFEFPDNTKSLIVGMGCFWGVERVFWKMPGVWSTHGKLKIKIYVAQWQHIRVAYFRRLFDSVKVRCMFKVTLGTIKTQARSANKSNVAQWQRSRAAYFSRFRLIERNELKS